MRWLNRRIRNERGATAITVALLLVPILGFAGLAIDVGGMYWENAQLQNGADAAALSVAQTCARSSTCSAPWTTADALAGANANDGLANDTISFKNGTPSSGQVTVQTSTRTANGVFIDHAFWNAVTGMLGLPTQFTTEYTQATAVWGAPSTATIPIAISTCDFARMAFSTSHDLIQLNQKNQSSCASGGSYPNGGFGWLDEGTCSATVTNGAVGSTPGNSYPNVCDSTFVASLVGKTVLVPVFSGVSWQGSKATYTVAGFASFVITGWAFSGANTLPTYYADPTLSGSKACNGSCRGIQGYFTQFAPIDWTGSGVNPATQGSCTYGGCIARLVN